jgi:hypothetical protein
MNQTTRSIPWATTRIQMKNNLAKKSPGKFHYNPGNMSGKTIGTNKDESEQDGIHSRHDRQDKKTEKPPS